MTEAEAINVVNHIAKGVVLGLVLAVSVVVGLFMLWHLFWLIRKECRAACYIGLHNWGNNWGNTFGGKRGANDLGEGYMHGIYLQCRKCGRRRAIAEPTHPDEKYTKAFYEMIKERG